MFARTATEKIVFWPRIDFVSTVISVNREAKKPKLRKIEQQRSRVRLPKRKKSFASHIFRHNNDYNRAYLSHLIAILSDLHKFHSSALLNYCLNDGKNGDKQSTTVLSTICRQKAID